MVSLASDGSQFIAGQTLCADWGSKWPGSLDGAGILERGYV